MPTRHETGGTHGDIVSLASVAPGSDVIVELIGPTARGRAATVALHEGQVVECRARGSSGVVLHIPGHPEVIVPDDMAEAILVRPNPADGEG
jgi:hypothetical protein